MKRLFWLGVGLAAGAYLTRRAAEAAQNLTPAGIGANLADGLRELGAGLGGPASQVGPGGEPDAKPEQALHRRRPRRPRRRACAPASLPSRRALTALLRP